MDVTLLERFYRCQSRMESSQQKMWQLLEKMADSRERFIRGEELLTRTYTDVLTQVLQDQAHYASRFKSLLFVHEPS